MTTRSSWHDAYRSATQRSGLDGTTLSGIPLEPVYGPEDAEYPGVWPFTAGPYASMYRSKFWTMRQFAGFGTAEDTNQRFHQLLRAGGSGLSTAFDMPTLMGRDSDHPLALGEVGRAGVAVDTLADMEVLFDGIDLGAVTTSMTINSAAPTVLAMYVTVADRAGIPRERVGGTIQNDILKEYQAQKEYMFPPRASLRLVSDTIRFCTAELPALASGLGVRVPHPRSRFDCGTGARLHAGERVRLRRSGHRGRPRRRRVRPSPQLLLQRAHRLLRGDREVSGGAPDLGALDARPIRGSRSSDPNSSDSTPRRPGSRSPHSSPR